MENLYPDGTSIKLVVHPQLANNDKDPTPSISFTCNGKLKEYVLNQDLYIFFALHALNIIFQ